MFFKNIHLKEWQQFEKIEIDFHDRVTILTGANGSGKTTLLNILAKHFNWELDSLATPKQDRKSGIVKFVSRLFNGEDKSNENVIGTIGYSNGTAGNLQISGGNAAQYQIQITNKQNIKCFYIPSHRPIYRYQAVGNIPTTKKNKQTAFQEVSNSYRERYFGGNSQPISFFMKNTLIGWMIQGYGVHKANQKTIMPADAEQIRYFEGFQEVLKKILPASLNFNEIEIRNMEVVFVCNDGKDEFILETASGGISALLDMAWQIYMYSTKENGDFTVLIDEVENHLHPTMQRQVLQDLVKAFPSARFIVSTHSPLVVNSVKDSNIYALKYNEKSKIDAHKLDFKNKARTAAEILDEVLGVSFTMPMWAEEHLKQIVSKYAVQKELNSDTLGALRQELALIGLEKLMPSAIHSLVEDKAND
ncbi:MAG: AAA family ATPase [Calditrichia bacterium]